jgi:hypothetical protein
MGLLKWLTSRFDRRMPQDTVCIDDQGVRLLRGNGTVESIEWDDFQAVYIDTTDTGPFADDVFYVLVGKDAVLVVPSEASGAGALYERLGDLPGFSNDAAVAAMCCTDNARFVCWRRDGLAT